MKNQDTLEKQVKEAYLSIGSNLGNRINNIEIAKFQLEQHKIKILKCSSNYLSNSWPNPSLPKYINIILKVATRLNPLDFLKTCNLIEKKLGRIKTKKNEPRTCDIDIIDYNSQIIDFKYNNLEFIVPHVNLVYRNFVLIPLKEILPEWKHPKTKEPIDLIIDKLSHVDKKSILKIKKS